MTLSAEDQLAIYKLIADYNHLVDAGDGAAWADLFVDGGSLDTGLGMVIEGGRDALVEFGSMVPQLSPGSRHIATNVSIEGEGSSATAACYLQMWGTDADATKTHLVVSGIYRDELRKDDGRWRFVSRVLRPDQGGPATRD